MEDTKKLFRSAAFDIEVLSLLSTFNYASDPLGSVSDNKSEKIYICADLRYLNTGQLRRVSRYGAMYEKPQNKIIVARILG